ncbi:MAG: transporter [Spirochaetes bacterium]|jgi:hypothetical protein|nr:transporter [Spirochaetota bacterium]
MSFLLLFINENIHAAHPLITDDTGTQGKGKFELEFNGEYGYERTHQEREFSTSTQFTMTYGIIDKLDLSVNFPYQSVKIRTYPIIGLFNKEAGSDDLKAFIAATYDDWAPLFKRTTSTESGFGDNSVELKWNFLESGRFNFALKPGISVPTGGDLGAGKFGAYGFLITTINLEPFTIHVNLGYIRNENTVHEKKDIWHASAACEFELVKGFRLVANTGAERNPEKSTRVNLTRRDPRDPDRITGMPPVFVLGGFIWSPTENFDFDAGFKYGLTKAETDYSAMSGVTIRF